MRIIKENKIEKEHKCINCKSIFAYKESDKTSIFGVLECPVCGKYNEPSIFDKKVKEK